MACTAGPRPHELDALRDVQRSAENDVVKPGGKVCPLVGRRPAGYGVSTEMCQRGSPGNWFPGNGVNEPEVRKQSLPGQ